MKKDRDVLFLCQFFYPEYISSAMLPFDTAKYLNKQGYKVGVLCGYPKEYRLGDGVPLRENIEGVDIRRINYVQVNRKKMWGRIVNYFSFVTSMLFHIRQARKYKSIILYSNPPLLPIIALICRKIYKNKVIYVSYDVYPEIAIKTNVIENKGITAKFFIKLNKNFFAKVDTVIALSEDMKQYLQENRKIDSSKVVVIPNWYEDCKQTEGKQTDILKNVPTDAFIISYLGNLGTCQDETVIVELAKQLSVEKDVFFVVAGHGNKMEMLKTTVKDEKLMNVIIFPFLHGNDYETVLCKSNMCMVTLVPGLEGLCAPSKTYAYLMSGKPVIAVMDKTMEIAKDIVEYNAGIVCAEGRYEEAGIQIGLLKKNDVLFEKMGHNSRQLYLEKYEKNVCLKRYVELLDSLL